jgi:photosystem II stability/assembly factor-like uncharacterized protein
VTLRRIFRLPASGAVCGTPFGPVALPLMLILIVSASPARGHDPSAWGGLFRSRDDGATWMSANRGDFLTGVIALAVSPTDANHLLLGTESGLFRSRNRGRDWTIEAPSVVRGSVFAATFCADGRRALISTGLGILSGEDDKDWRPVPAPPGAAPARAIVSSGEAGGVYLAGWTGLHRSDDWGATWWSAADGFLQEPATALLALRGTPETLYAIVKGQLWATVDWGRSWARQENGLPPGNADVIARDLRQPARLWAAGADRLFRSDDAGANWQRVGPPLPEPNTAVRGIAASEEAIIVTTDRGLYRSVAGVASWALISDNLPAHLEAGPLVPDPTDPATLYAGFSLIPYPELWRRAADRESALARVSVASLAGSVVLLILVALATLAALRWLGGRYYHRSASPVRSTRGVGMRGKRLP